MPDSPFADTRNNVARAADLMTQFAREIQEKIDSERSDLRRVYGGEVQE